MCYVAMLALEAAHVASTVLRAVSAGRLPYLHAVGVPERKRGHERWLGAKRSGRRLAGYASRRQI